jgi:hypothetical protein
MDVAEAARSPIPRAARAARWCAKTMQSRIQVFRETLRELGYEEGRNLAIESRFADGAYDQPMPCRAHSGCR